MNNRIYLIILLLTCKNCIAQNLVPNGDFEQYSNCPMGWSEINFAVPWISPSTIGSPDYYNQCADTSSPVNVPNTAIGFQVAHSGGGYSGIYVGNNNNIREFIEAPLTSTLVANTCYHFEMYVNLANACKYTTDDIAVYFSDTSVTGITSFSLPFTPQINNIIGNTFDSLGWTLVSGNYTATGGENYLIVGNYKNDANTTILLLYPGALYNYIYCYIDDVSLTPCATGINTQIVSEEINIYPNPVIDKLNIIVKDNQLSEIILYDIASRKILQQKFINAVSLNTKQLARGLYHYEVRDKNGLCKKGTVVKD